MEEKLWNYLYKNDKGEKNEKKTLQTIKLELKKV
jgi:hypothetical protein